MSKETRIKTITDIASAANVSVATVSKVFNGYDCIAEETRCKVMQIARDMDYFPSHHASRLVRGEEEGVCIILSSFGANTSNDEYLMGILSGIHNEAENNGMRTVIATDKYILRDDKNYVQFCRSHKFMGFIIHGLGMNDHEIPYLVKSEVPCVFIDNMVEGRKTVSVSTDNFRSCVEMVNVLTGLGHKKITFIAGSKEALVTQERIKGYTAAMIDNNLCPVIVQSDFTYTVSYQKIKEFILNKPETTAVFCASDIIAAAAVSACIDLGYKVPDDFSVVGFDDLHIASYMRPSLSTVAQDFFNMGKKAFEMLVNIHMGKKVLPFYYIPHELKIRQSVSKNTRKEKGH